MTSRNPPGRVLSPRRWREYVKALFPGLHLTKTRTDLCDRCMRIDLELKCPGLSAERKKALEEEKATHVEDAILQRRVWSNFVKDYTGKIDPNLVLPDSSFPVTMSDDESPSLEIQSTNEVKEKNEILDACGIDESEEFALNGSLKALSVEMIKPSAPLFLDIHFPVQNGPAERDQTQKESADHGDYSVSNYREKEDSAFSLSTVQIQAEDFGGGIALPHYGFRKPSADYFNSNLMLHNFVIADITGEKNRVYFYDERSQGKGADALCSLRLRYHLEKMKVFHGNGIQPKLSMSLLDNCVGQNKSQVVMQFMCLLSVLFYKVVALMYFLPGHSHMLPDRVVGYCKRAIRSLNLYTPSQIVDNCSKVKSVYPEFLQKTDQDKPFRVNWAVKLSKYFAKMPSGFTSYYFFEFTNGYVTYRRLANSPGEEALTHKLIDLTNGTRELILMDLFGTTDIDKIGFRDLTLPVHPGIDLKEAKLKSLSKKYFSIPKDFLDYYPKY